MVCGMFDQLVKIGGKVVSLGRSNRFLRDKILLIPFLKVSQNATYFDVLFRQFK
jgi:hypothetical protein